MKKIKNHQWYAMLGLLLGCLFAPRPAHAQFVLYVYDPTRHVMTLANSTSTEKKFNEAIELKNNTYLKKVITSKDYIFVDILDGYMYGKEKELSNADLKRMKQMYDQVNTDIDELWDQLDRIYLQSNDTVRQKCEAFFKRSKEISDYRRDQIQRRMDRFVGDAVIWADNKERITVMEDCFDQMKQEKVMVGKSAFVLFSLSTWHEGMKGQEINVLIGTNGK